MRPIFLEGDSGSGKTTFILNRTAEVRKFATGFVTQKILKNGKIAAHILRSAKEIDLPIKEELESCETPIIVKGSQGKIYASETIKYLSHTPLDRFYILDELGGIETCDTAFRTKLMEILEGQLPVVGVFKSEKNFQRMADYLKFDEWQREKYRALREQVQNRSHLIQFTKENFTKIEALFAKLLREIEI